MITVTKTNTRGFRSERFRNQPVHQFYEHLKSGMHSVEPKDTYINLFARPEIDGFSSDNAEIEWSTSLSGKAVHYSTLSDLEKQKVDRYIDEAFSSIRNYVEENRDKSGKDRDYALFLNMVAKKPHCNQIWVVGGKPTIVQWGYSDENNLMGSSGIYPNWDSFISEIQIAKSEEKRATEESNKQNVSEKVEEVVPLVESSSLFTEAATDEKASPSVEIKPKQAVEEKPVEKPLPKPANKSKKPVKKQESKKSAMAGLGGYAWVKWLAIILFIIILILLLLRFLPHNQFGPMGGFGGGPTIINGGAGAPAGGMIGGTAPVGGMIGGPDGGNSAGGNGSSGSGNGYPAGGNGSAGSGSGYPAGGNGATGAYQGGNSAGGNDVGGNHKYGNYTGGNSVGDNYIGGNHTGGNHTGGNYTGGNDVGGSYTGGNDAGDNHEDGNYSGGNNVAGDRKGDNSTDGNSDDGAVPANKDKKDNGDNADAGIAPKSDVTDSDNKVNSNNSGELCPVCRKTFKSHSQDDWKKCLLSAQEGREELKKTLQKLVNDMNTDSADGAGEQ